MNRMLMAGESGLRGTQFWVDSIAHNVANVSTPAFRRWMTDFDAAATVPIDQATIPTLTVGNGVTVSGTRLSQEQGTLQATGEMFDMAVEGPGYFTIRGQDGQIQYTRNGTFHRDGMGRLTTEDGCFVLGDDDKPIELGVEGGEVTVDFTGRLLGAGTDSVPGRLGLVTFEDAERLSSAGQQRYVETAESGPPQKLGDDATETRVRQGYRELSNVDLATELTHLIIAERAFQLAARMVQEGDRVDEVAADLNR